MKPVKKVDGTIVHPNKGLKDFSDAELSTELWVRRENRFVNHRILELAERIKTLQECTMDEFVDLSKQD